jgi:hypothetical protein
MRLITELADVRASLDHVRVGPGQLVEDTDGSGSTPSRPKRWRMFIGPQCGCSRRSSRARASVVAGI